MKKALEIFIVVFGIICVLCLCCQPAEGTPLSKFYIWQGVWFGAFLLDILLAYVLDKKGIIDSGLHDNEL